MRAEAVKLGQALLDHHRALTTRTPPAAGRKVIPGRYTIPYSKLCEQAGSMTRSWATSRRGARASVIPGLDELRSRATVGGSIRSESPSRTGPGEVAAPSQEGRGREG